MQSTLDILEGVAIGDWIATSSGQTVEAYVAAMRRGDASRQETWGGFLELAILCHKMQQPVVRAHVFEHVGGKCYLLTTVGSEAPDAADIFLVWLGTHWEGLWLSDAAQDLLREARAAPSHARLAGGAGVAPSTGLAHTSASSAAAPPPSPLPELSQPAPEEDGARFRSQACSTEGCA